MKKFGDKKQSTASEYDEDSRLNINSSHPNGRNGGTVDNPASDISNQDYDEDSLVPIHTKTKVRSNQVMASPLGMTKKPSDFDMNVFANDMEPTAGAPGTKSSPTFAQSPAGIKIEDPSEYYRRAGEYIEYGSEVRANLKQATMLDFHEPPALDESDDDDDVYPLSIKYNKRRACKIAFYRYVYLFIFIILLTPTDIYTFNEGRKSDYRIGYFSDWITEKSLGISGVTEFEFQIKNCYIFLLENTRSTSNIDLYISSNRATSISTSLKSGIQTIVVDSNISPPYCYVEIKVPGGVDINKISFEFNGGQIQDLLIRDYKDSSTWETPMKISTLQFIITDAYPIIEFNNAHEIGTLDVDGNYCSCSFDSVKINVMEYDIEVGSLKISQHSDYAENKVIVTTPYGTHCVAGETIVHSQSGTCPTESQRLAGISGTYVDTTTVCTETMFVCSNSTSSCPTSATDTPSSSQGYFTITQDDGPIEFLIDGSTTSASNTYNPKFDTFSITSQVLLTENKETFTDDPDTPRIFLYEVISPGYKRLWVHSSLKQYIEARPWLLSMMSLTILQPKYVRQTLIHIPDESCPLKSPLNVEQNTYIKTKLDELSYTEAKHLFAMKYNQTYYEYELTAEGDFQETEIPFLGGNISITLCLVVSCILATYCVIAVFLILIRLKWQFERMMDKYLEKNRRFSIAKKEIQYKNDETKKKQVVTKSKKRIVKILKMGFLTTWIKLKHIVFTDEDEAEIKLKQKMKKKISLSFFQTPALYLEHLRRQRANSFKEFLNSVYESPAHFPKWKLNSEASWKSTSVRLDLLEAVYLEFCTREGFKPRNIEEEINIIKEYNLTLEYKIDTTTDAYTHIRWKTPLEKFEESEAVKLKKEAKGVKEDEASLIAKFLVSECSKSAFKRDFILISELKERYNRYCSDKNIDDLVKINIVGSQEIEQFGAKMDLNLYIPYLSGITLMKLPGLKQSNYTPGVIRIPKETKARKRNIGCCTKFKNKLMHFLFSKEGIITNLFVVFIHVLLLTVIPVGMFIAITWSLLQVDVINQDVYAISYDINHVFHPSYYDFWLDSLEGRTLWFVIAGLCAFYIFSGLLELISFYATGARDTGKYIVSKTWFKWFLGLSFWMILVLFIALYTAYLSVILVWCILGAVLSPEKFLPMAVAAIVLVVVAALIYSRLKQVHKSLEGAVGNAVDQQLQQSLTKTIKKEQTKMNMMYNRSVDLNTQNQFHKAINSYMIKNNYPIVHKSVTDAILDGNLGMIINMMFKHCGIDNNIGLGLVGWLKQDQTIILDSIDKLSTDLELDRSINNILGEIALDNYNPDSVGINSAQGTIILSLKKMFRKAFPQYPLETLDGLLQVVSEGDPRPLESILEKLNIPEPLFKMSIGFVMNDEKSIQDSIQQLCDDIFPDYYDEFFESLYTIFKGNPKAGLGAVSSNLGIKYEFLTQFIIAIIKQDNNLIRLSLSQSVDQIFTAVSNSGVYIQKENAWHLKNYLLAIYTLTRGSEFDMIYLVKESLPDINPYVVDVFYRAAEGNIKKFDLVLDSLGLITQKKVILEFCNLLYEKDVSLEEIGGKLGVSAENADILNAAIRFTVTAAKYFVRIRAKMQEKKLSTEKSKYDDRTQMADTMIELSDDIKKYLQVLYNNGVLPIDAPGFTGQIKKLTTFLKEMFDDFIGDEHYKEPPQFRELDMNDRKEAIAACSNTVLQKILKGDQTIVNAIIDEVFEYLEFKTEKKNYFKALCTIVASFVVDVSWKELDEDTDHQAAFKMVSLMLEIDEEYLELILDIFSGNPYRIFKCHTPNPKINLATNEITADFNTSRLATIADILDCKRREVRQLSAIWIHSYDLVTRGEKYISKLAQERLGIDSMFFYFIIMRWDETYQKTHDQTKISLCMSIRKFLNSHLKRVQYNIENDLNERPYFFEDLRTEEIGDHGTKDDPGLDDLPPDHEIYDNPIGTVNGRTKEDVISFIKIMNNVIKIKEGEPQIFESLFKVDKDHAKMISVVYNSIANKDLETYISVLLHLSTRVEVRLGVVNVNDQPDNDLFDELQNKEFKDLEKSFSQKDIAQNIFLQFILLFTCNKLNYILTKSTRFHKYKLEKKLNNLFFTLNKFLPDSQQLMTSSMTYDEVFPSLFEAGFFKKISKYFFHKVKPFLQAITKPESIFGVIVGLSLQNKNLIRNSIIKLIGSDVKKQYINGVFGFIVNDPIQEKDMRAVIKKIGLNADLSLNLVEIVTENTDRDKYNAALAICKKYCTASQRVSALVAMFKCDLSNIRVI